MKITIVFCLLAAAAAHAQTPQSFAAAGVSYNPGAAPAIAGTGMYARGVANTGTYAFTVIDALPVSAKPFTVTTQISAGVAQKILTLNGIPIFIPTSAGVSYSGDHQGWSWTTGALAVIPIPHSATWKVLPNIRIVKSSVSNGAGYQVIGGVLVGWGW